MPITFEEAALAFARQVMRAEKAEAEVKELQKKLEEREPK